MPDYLDKKELLRELTEFINTNTASTLFKEQIALMADGIQKKYGRQIDPDDFLQEIWVLLISKKHRINLDRDVFNYLTTCFINLLHLMHRKSYKRGLPLDPSELDFREDFFLPKNRRTGSWH